MKNAASRGVGSATFERNTEASNVPPSSDPDKIIIAKFWKSRSRSEHIVVSLFRWHDMPLFDIRVFVDEVGCSKPSKKGVAISIKKLDELIAALQKARAKAAALGWLE